LAEPRPRLSVVVISYEMARELPRTIRSLSPAVQRGIEAGDYELIVVDNGSREPPAFDAFGAQVRTLRIQEPGPSPAAALNRGIAEARAPLVGAMIDGARLASPGLLRHALVAAALDDRAVIATLGFHLGPDLQRRAIAAGYDQAAEDALLERAGWTEDGYRLFDVAVPAHSAAGGWFEVPTESNAIFMPAELWAELGGFDERFTSPGGGFVNLDLFARACALPDSLLVILLGEATFHQVHGGVATNAPTLWHERFAEEYERLCGAPPGRPDAVPLYLGSRPPGPLERAPTAQERHAAALARVDLVKDALVAGGAPRARLNLLQRSVATALRERVAGDVAACGDGHERAAVLMRAVLAAFAVTNRRVWSGEAPDGLAVLDVGGDASGLAARVRPGGLVVTDPGVELSAEVVEAGAGGTCWRARDTP
jgi:hypothetical protein